MAWYGAGLKILHQTARLAYRLPRLSFEARLIEYDFVHSNIANGRTGVRQRILDVGCGGSRLPIELAHKGHEVYGIDGEPYPEGHPFTFVQGDIMQMPFDDNFFEIVTVVSTIEHVGLGRYGDPVVADGDKQAIAEIVRVLKPSGMMIMTIPCGYDTMHRSKEGMLLGRVYSSQSLVKLLSGFKILEMSYIVKRKGIWFPTVISRAEREVRRARPDKVGVTAIALIVACNLKKGAHS